MPARSLLVFVVLAVIGLMPAASTQAQIGRLLDDPEDYGVYAAILPIGFGSGDTDMSRVALLDETRSATGCPREETFGPEWRSVLENYKSKNMTVRTLRRDLPLSVPYELVSLSAVKTLLQRAGFDEKILRGGWHEAYANFPNGKLLAVSAVGFDRAKTRAIVTVQYNCGLSLEARREHDCHGGYQIPLERAFRQWIRANGAPSCVWIT